MRESSPESTKTFTLSRQLLSSSRYRSRSPRTALTTDARLGQPIVRSVSRPYGSGNNRAEIRRQHAVLLADRVIVRRLKNFPLFAMQDFRSRKAAKDLHLVRQRDIADGCGDGGAPEKTQFQRPELGGVPDGRIA